MATPQFDNRLPVTPVRAVKNEGTVEFNKLQLQVLYKLDSQQIGKQQAQYEVEKL